MKFGLIVLVSSALVEGLTADINEAKRRLSENKISEALDILDSIVRNEPENAQALYVRATAHLSNQRYDSALNDFDRVSNLKTDFMPSILEAAKLLLKTGRYTEVLKRLKGNSNPDAVNLYNLTTEVEKKFKSAQNLSKGLYFSKAIEEFEFVLEHSPYFITALRLKAEAHLALRQLKAAMKNYEAMMRLSPDNRATHLLVSKIAFSLGDAPGGFRNLQACMKLDPEYSPCIKFFKKMNGFEKRLKNAASQNTETAIATVLKVFEDLSKADPDLKDNELPPLNNAHLKKTISSLCDLYLKDKNGKQAISWCSKAKGNENDDPETLSKLGEAYLLDEEYEAAIRVLNQAYDISKDSDIKAKLDDAQIQFKRSKKRDYYKILGVDKKSSLKDIKRAYRKLLQQWHPDKHDGDKDESKRKMTEINTAYEILSDEKKRAEYDAGFDPNDPEAQRGAGPHGFPFSQDQLFKMFKEQNFGGGRPGSGEFFFHF